MRSLIHSFYLFIITLTFLGCGNSKPSSYQNNIQAIELASAVPPEEIYSWSNIPQAADVMRNTKFESENQNTSTKILWYDQEKYFYFWENYKKTYIFRGWLVNGLSPYFQIYLTVSSPVWPFTTSGSSFGEILDIAKIDSDVDCNYAVCTYTETVGINLSFEELTKLATKQGTFDFRLEGSEGSVEYSIPTNYLKGFVLAVQSYIDS